MSKKNLNQTSIKNITVLFGVILAALLIILLLIRLVIHLRSGLPFDSAGFIDTLIGSLLSIILPLLIFNIFYEYFVRAYSSNEISEKITETILSKKEVVDMFEDTAKKQFIKTTLQSLVREEKGDVVYDMINPYLQSQLTLRKEFKYSIVLRHMTEKDAGIWGNYLRTEDYWLIKESLSYTKIYGEKSSNLPGEMHIGFFMDDCIMDKYFKDKRYIFRENLVMHQEDLVRASGNKEDFFEHCFNLKVLVNDVKVAVIVSDINEAGILVSVKIPKDSSRGAVKFDISFTMPQLKEKNTFLVALNEPTFRPRISFIFPGADFQLTTIPFFDESYEDTSSELNIDGIKEIELKNWVLPRSGVVFVWNRK